MVVSLATASNDGVRDARLAENRPEQRRPASA
jgi:hypothetical protein